MLAQALSGIILSVFLFRDDLEEVNEGHERNFSSLANSLEELLKYQREKMREFARPYESTVGLLPPSPAHLPLLVYHVKSAQLEHTQNTGGPREVW